MEMCRTIPIAIILCLLITACSNDARREPASPEILPQWPMVTGSESPHRTILGLWTVAINDDHSAAEVVPIRTAELHLNTVRLLEVTPCTSCLMIGNIIPVGPNTIDVEVTLRHPFPGLLKYTGFDVRGIFISKADYAFPPSGRSIAWSDDVPRLLNYDGYTHLFNPTEFPEGQPGPPALHYITGKQSTGGELTSTLNPFVAYRKDAPRRMFEAGGQETKTFRIQAPAGPIWFGYAVDASWQLTEDVVDPENDFPLSANCLEPYEIIVNAGTGMMPDEGGMTGVEVRAYDHQGHQTVTSACVYAPQLFDGEVSLQLSANNGEPYALFGGIIRNERGAVEGTYPLLVRVTDEGDDPNLGPVDAWQVYELEVRPRRGWATTWGDGGLWIYTDYLGDITTDRDGNSFVIVYKFHKPYQTIAKLSPNGDSIWEIVFSPEDHIDLQDVTTDNGSNFYVIGQFFGNIDFDPGPGEDYHDAGHQWDSFFSKYDTDGNYVWTRTWGGVHDEIMSIDSHALYYSGRIYMIGEFMGVADFDPGPDEYLLTSVGEWDPYLTVFSDDGSWERAISWGGLEGDYCSAISLDPGGSVYLGGTYLDTVDFDPGPSEDIRSEPDDGNCYLMKLNSFGVYQWVRTWGAPGSADCTSIAAGISENVFILGWISGISDLDPGLGEDIRLHEDGSIYLSCFTPAGDYLWALNWGDEAVGMAAMSTGDLYVVGRLLTSGTRDLDPGPEENPHASPGSDVIMHLNKISSTGESIWVRVWDEAGNYFGPKDVDVDAAGNVFVGGHFCYTCDFDPGLGFDYHVPSKSTDVFVTMMPPDGYW
jgi:hypothetical protein